MIFARETERRSTFFEARRQDDTLIFRLQGEWTIDNVRQIESELARVPADWSSERITVDDSVIGDFDLSGAWLLYRWIQDREANRQQVDVSAMQSHHMAFIDQVLEDHAGESLPARKRARLREHIETTGRRLSENLLVIRTFITFCGQVFTVMGYCLLNPSKLRFPAIARHIEETGFNAIPIVSLLAFLISIVMAYQGTTQLSRFGAEIYTIDLVAISVLREMGVLLTAIMVAGRSGSAFAAEIGVMKLNQEVAAMQTLGINPMHALMVPRTLALMITLPALTLFADLVGFCGGAVVSIFALEIPPAVFFERLTDVVTPTHFWVGMSKAPVFAFFIAVIGIHQGFQVEHSAEDVGRNTTRAVVQSIFAVIALDAIYSIVTTELGF